MKKKFISTIGIFLAFAMVVPMSIVRAERDSEQNRDHDESVSNSNDDGDWDSESEDMDDDGDGMVATGTPVTAPTKDTKSKDDDDSNSQGDSHRSAVATFVQDLKNSADKIKTKSIGDEVRDIATGQEKSIDAISKAAGKLEGRGRFVRFLIGPDTDSLNSLKAELSGTDARIDRLKEIAATITNTDVKAALNQEIADLESERAKLGQIANSNESAKSMFGWLIRLFNR